MSSKIALSGFFGDTSGYGQAARRIYAALVAAGERPSLGLSLTDGLGQLAPNDTWPELSIPFIESQPVDSADVHLIVAAASDYPMFSFKARHTVGFTCWETDTLPRSYVAGAEQVDKIIVPSSFNAGVWKKEKLTRPVKTAMLPILDIPAQNVEPLDSYTFYCVTPDTKILTSDLKWVEAGSLILGDKIIGFDENQEEHRERRLKPSLVTHTGRITRRVFKLILSDWSTVKSSSEHPWLASTGNAYRRWITTENIVQKLDSGLDVFLPKYLDTWDTATDRKSGYVAGFFDGEGHVSFTRLGERKHLTAFALGAAQKKGIVLDTITEFLSNFNVNFKILKNTSSDVYNLTIKGGWKENLKFLGNFRPLRLIEKYMEKFSSGEVLISLRTNNVLKVIGYEDLGEQEVVSLETSTHTYFAEGFAAHNSVLTVQERKNLRSLLIAFLTTFTAYDTVQLLLKVHGPAEHAAAAQMANQLLDAMRLPNPPGVKIISRQMTDHALWAFHQTCDCYISLTRGEAIGLPIIDAMTVGNPVIVTGWGGHLDYLKSGKYSYREGIHLIRSRMTPVVQDYVHFGGGDQLWADPDILDARDKMRDVLKVVKERGTREKLAHDFTGMTLAESGKALLECIYGD